MKMSVSAKLIRGGLVMVNFMCQLDWEKLNIISKHYV